MYIYDGKNISNFCTYYIYTIYIPQVSQQVLYHPISIYLFSYLSIYSSASNKIALKRRGCLAEKVHLLTTVCVCVCSPCLNVFFIFASLRQPYTEEMIESMCAISLKGFPLDIKSGASEALCTKLERYPSTDSVYTAIYFRRSACTASHGWPRADQPPG